MSILDFGKGKVLDSWFPKHQCYLMLIYLKRHTFNYAQKGSLMAIDFWMICTMSEIFNFSFSFGPLFGKVTRDMKD
jgi:hypothetical protein